MYCTNLKDNMEIDRERRSLAIRRKMLTRRFAYWTDTVKIMLF